MFHAAELLRVKATLFISVPQNYSVLATLFILSCFLEDFKLFVLEFASVLHLNCVDETLIKLELNLASNLISIFNEVVSYFNPITTLNACTSHICHEATLKKLN